MNKTFAKLAAILTIAGIIFSSCEDKKSEGSLQLGSKLPALKCLSTEPIITSAVVTITDDKGSKVYENYKVEIMNMSGYYISKPLSLKEGSYKLCSFALADNNNNMLYATPVAGSSKAYLVQRPLSCDFTITKDDVTKLEPEVISTASCVPQDFGYATFTYSIVKTFDFYLGVLVYDDLIKNFKLTDAVFTAAAPGKSIVTLNIPAATQRISMPSGYATYSISVSKQGYKTYTKTFAEEELAAYNGSVDSAVLKVILEKKSYLDCLIAYFPFNGSAADVSVNKLASEIIGGVTASADRNGVASAAMKFNGIDGFVKVSHADILNADNISISAWIKPDAFNNFTNGVGKSYWQYSGIFNKKGTSSTNQTSFSTSATSSIFRLSGRFSDNTPNEPGIREQIFTGAWQHVVYVIDNGSIKLYKNGVLLMNDNVTAGKTITKNTEPVLIGKTYWFPDYSLLESYFCGSIDEMYIFKCALSDEEITDLYNTK